MDTTAYLSKLERVRSPLQQLLILELKDRKIAPDDFDFVDVESTLYYLKANQPLAATGKFDPIPDGRGVIGFYLNQEMDVSLAIAKVATFLLRGQSEKLYSKVRVFSKDGEIEPPVYVFTSVAIWKELPG